MARKARRGQAQAAATRTYHSTPAAPEQIYFPARRTTVVKTYSTRKTSSARSLRQQTLTQIDYVKQAEAGDADDSALLESPTKPERPKKRRKTLGDTPSSSFHTQTLTQFLKGDNDQEDDMMQIKDSDEEDDKDVKMKGNARTKGKGKGKGKGKEVLFAPPAPAPTTPSSKRIKVNLDEVPSSQPTPFTPLNGQSFTDKYGPLGEYRSPLKEKSANDASVITQAQISKIPRNLTIQDSYSPGSSAQFSSSLASSSPNKKPDETPDKRPAREPLAELPLGSYDLGEDAGFDGPEQETPTKPRTRSSQRRSYREIPDSDAELESVGPSPLKSRSTLSQLRRDSEQESQEVITSEDVEVDIAAASTPGSVVRIPQTPHKARSVLAAHSGQRAVPESPVIYTDPHAPAPGTPAIYVDPEPGDQATEAPAPYENTEINEDQETSDLVTETPRRNAKVIDDDSASTASESEDGPDPGTPTPVAKKVQIQLPPSSGPEEEEEEEEEILRETPRKISPRKRSPRKNPSPKKSSPLFQRQTQRQTQRQHTQGKSQYYSQGLESQRIPLEEIRNLGPITDTSDALITMPPDSLDKIVGGTKDHEFRPYKFPTETTRLWIYTNRPVGEVRYMATIGPPKKQGEPDSQTGEGNSEFNSGLFGEKMHAYELIQVYELNNPVPKKDMKEHGMGDKSPHRYRLVPPAIVGQLLANLKRKLFLERGELGEDEDELEEEGLEGGDKEDLTVSQELEEQIRSDIIGSTQMVPPRSSQEEGGRHVPPQPHEEIIPASQEETPRTDDDVFARPALPRPAPPPSRSGPPPPATATATASRFSSRIRSQRSQRSQRSLQRVPSHENRNSGNGNNMVRPSQATTASEISSPGGSPSKTSSSLLSSVPRPSTSSVLDALLDDCSSPILGLGGGLAALGTASQVNRLVMQDSLMVDEVRAPPQGGIWDSDDEDEGGEGEDQEDGVLPTL
ncbi:hypothetical protein V8F20_003365 [Naviculisporaceae sp. PSN 640]